jgi:type VI secretion system secreted protein VgrG
VVGPKGEEIWVDKYGRVKVQFHWDRIGSLDENSSCWVRVSTAWAGSNFGAVFTPRIGMEVIIDFLNGDPDYPILTGCVYNANNMPPWQLPANATQSGLLTRSSKGGAPGAGEKNGAGDANAIRFEDKAGAEQLWLHAQKDQLTEVEHDEDKWVGNDRRKTVDGNETNVIHKNRTETVDIDETITVHGNRTETVDKDETITIHQNRKERVDLNETISVGQNRSETVGINEKVKIGVNQNLKVGSNKTETIGLTSMKNVGIAQMTNIGAAYNLNVGAAWMSNVGFMHMHNVGVKFATTVGNSYSVSSGSSVNVSAGETMVHQAGNEMTMVCGASSITLKKDGTIMIKGVQVEIEGTKIVDVDGKLIDMN